MPIGEAAIEIVQVVTSNLPFTEGVKNKKLIGVALGVAALFLAYRWVAQTFVSNRLLCDGKTLESNYICIGKKSGQYSQKASGWGYSNDHQCSLWLRWTSKVQSAPSTYSSDLSKYPVHNLSRINFSGFLFRAGWSAIPALSLTALSVAVLKVK